MPNIKSAEKRARTAKVRAARNASVKSSVKTAIKRYEQHLSEGKLDEAKSSLVSAVRTLDKAAAKGVIHKNEAARRKSRLTRRYSSVAAEGSE